MTMSMDTKTIYNAVVGSTEDINMLLTIPINMAIPPISGIDP
jgi:hypothetical protein